MKFSEHLYELASPIWDAIEAHPFIQEMGDASLPSDKFQYYLAQDYVFLVQYHKLFSLASVKAPSLQASLKFSELALSLLQKELDAHRDYAQTFNISPQALEATAPAPTTLAYSNFLRVTAYEGTFSELVAALLPCVWSYSRIGRNLAKKQTSEASESKYQHWIQLYASDHFAVLAKEFIAMIDAVESELSQSQLSRMESCFMTASRYEYLFWDMAYTGEQWSI